MRSLYVTRIKMPKNTDDCAPERMVKLTDLSVLSEFALLFPVMAGQMVEIEVELDKEAGRLVPV